MRKPISAGDLRERVHFQKRTVTDDGYGNPVSGPFETQFTAGAHLRPLVGKEEILAARLAGTQPYVVTVRSSANTRLVTPAWRLVDSRDLTRVFDIKAIADPSGRRQWLEMLTVSGDDDATVPEIPPEIIGASYFAPRYFGVRYFGVRWFG